MNTRTIVQKLKSTKLWCAVAGVAVGAAIALGVNASEIETVAGAVMAVVSAISYIFVEGRVDAAAVGNAVEKVQNAVDVVTGNED